MRMIYIINIINNNKFIINLIKNNRNFDKNKLNKIIKLNRLI